jgi:hypothetical protein
MFLDNPPNQIARRGAFLSGKHLDLPEDRLWKFHDTRIMTMVPCPARSWKFPPPNRAFARTK